MKGCLGVLALMVGVGLGMYTLLHWTPFAGSIGIPVISAILVGLTVGNVWGLGVALRRKRAASRPPAQWRNGDFVGYSGKLETDREPLVAPGSGRVCAIYEYQVERLEHVRRNKRTETVVHCAWRGAGMTACHVRGPTQRFRLHGFPILTGSEQNVADPAALRRVAAHILSSTIVPKAGIGARIKTWSAILADADGVVRHDEADDDALDLDEVRRGGPDDPGTPEERLADRLAHMGCHVREKLFTPGEAVAAFGTYDAAAQAIDIGSGLEHLDRGLERGDGARIAGRTLRNNVIALLVFGALAVVFHGWLGRAVLPGWRAGWTPERRVGLDDAFGAAFGATSSTDELVQTAQDDDPWATDLLLRLGADPNPPSSEDTEPLQQATDPVVAELLLKAGADPNIADHVGHTPLMRFAEIENAAMVKVLLAHGADPNRVDEYQYTALMHAARNGNLEVARALLDGGADPDRRGNDGASALDEARTHGHDKLAGLLVERGADDVQVGAADGVAIAADHPIARLIGAYLIAIQSADTATIDALHPRDRPIDWSTIDWPAYSGGRPSRIDVLEGYATESMASARVRGSNADGAPMPLTLGFQLERDPAAAGDGPLARYDGWRIVRDWIQWSEVEAAR